MGRAPKKAKVADEGDALDDQERTILEYMNAQNRPYGATDVFTNLHQTIGKTSVVRILASLHERGLIAGKAYGKALIYVARQDTQPAPSAEELAALDDQVESEIAAVATIRETHREAQARVTALLATPTTADVHTRIETLRAETAEMRTRLEALQTGAASVDPAEKLRIDAAHALYHREWRARRRMCLDAVKCITENLPQSPSAFMEELGMEQDTCPPPKV